VKSFGCGRQIFLSNICFEIEVPRLKEFQLKTLLYIKFEGYEKPILMPFYSKQFDALHFIRPKQLQTLETMVVFRSSGPFNPIPEADGKTQRSLLQLLLIPPANLSEEEAVSNLLDSFRAFLVNILDDSVPVRDIVKHANMCEFNLFASTVCLKLTKGTRQLS
jgi:hypothetical protein